jgi:hypothetical protein
MALEVQKYDVKYGYKDCVKQHFIFFVTYELDPLRYSVTLHWAEKACWGHWATLKL